MSCGICESMMAICIPDTNNLGRLSFRYACETGRPRRTTLEQAEGLRLREEGSYDTIAPGFRIIKN